MTFSSRAALIFVVLAASGCLTVRTSSTPRLVASGTWVGWGETADDSGFAVPGMLNGRPLSLVVDYGSNALFVTRGMYDSLHLPQPFANATRVKAQAVKPGIAPTLDSTADFVVQRGDSVIEYWGHFERLVVDSLRMGTSLHRQVLTGQVDYALLRFEGGLGREILSQFDINFDGSARTIRFYERSPPISPNSLPRVPRWLPSGIRPADCASVAVVGPKPLPTLEPADTAGLSEAERRKVLNLFIAAQRFAASLELTFPVVIENHAVTATFDSGTRDAIVNSAAAQLLGFTLANPRVRPDPGDSTLFASDVDVRVGGHKLASPRVWISDVKFSGAAEYETKPMMILGLTQFRDRVLFMSHNTGTVCIGPPR